MIRPWVLAAGKGGVGTTTLTAFLGAEAAARGFRTMVVDGSFGLAGLHRPFGLSDGSPGLAMLQDRAVDARDLLLEVAPDLWVLPGGGEQVRLLGPGGRAGVYRRVSRLFDSFDLVLIDAGSTLDGVLPVTQLHPAGLWVVTVGERTAMAGAYALVKVLSTQHKWMTLHPLFNRAGHGRALRLGRADR